MLIPFRDDVPRHHTPLVNYTLIAFNVAAFFWYWMLPPVPQHEFMLHHSFIPARLTDLREGNGVILKVPVVVMNRGREAVVELPVALPADRREVLYTVFTSMFMHGGWMHLLGNMWFLWLFGGNVENRLGSVRYIILYLIGGVLAAGMQWVDNPSSTIPMVGASGAIAAILGAYVITYPWARLQTLVFVIIFFTVIELPAILFLGGWFIYQFFSAKTDMVGGIAWWAHVGGFVAGMAIMPWIDPHRGDPAIDAEVERPQVAELFRV